MKSAILSDIHGNMEAFLSVLKDISLCQITRIFCLGDCIGYGPEPHKVLKIIKNLNITTVMGNHEMAILKSSCSSWFNPTAKESLRKTRKMLTPLAMDQISRFPRFKIYRHCRLVHGFPPNLIRMYLFQANDEKLLETFQKIPEPICFLGHTHQLEQIVYDGKRIQRKALEKEKVYLNENYHYIVNVGSVGQPRDGNNNAKYVIWDESEKSIEVRYVPYDIASTVAKIKRVGLPKVHGNRLWS
jgi:predicted phosphodiesterase